MIFLSTTAKELHHHVKLNKSFQSDPEWWAIFLLRWNGVGMMSSICRHPHSVLITSDASGGWGCGAYSSSNLWFQAQWPECWSSVHITVKELVPIIIVVACALWGDLWRGATVLCRCDNAAVVSIVNSGSSKDALVMHLMRSLFFIVAVNGISLYAQHIPGKYNNAADALSRNHISLFHQQVPSAAALPTPIPPRTMADLGTKPARLDIAELEKSVLMYFSKDLAPSTQRTYKSAQDRCHENIHTP